MPVADDRDGNQVSLREMRCHVGTWRMVFMLTALLSDRRRPTQSKWHLRIYRGAKLLYPKRLFLRYRLVKRAGLLGSNAHGLGPTAHCPI